MRNGKRTAVVSEHPLFRECLAVVLRQHGMHVLELATVAQLRGKPADVVVIDADHTEDIAAQLREHKPRAGAYVILLGSPLRLAAASNGIADVELESTRSDAPALLSAVSRRPPRPSGELARALRLWSEITPRQRDVLCHLAVGLDNTTIAVRLGVGERAIKAHVTALLDRFDLTNRTELALLAHRAGLCPTER